MTKLHVKVRIYKRYPSGRIWGRFTTSLICVANGLEIERVSHFMLLGRAR